MDGAHFPRRQLGRRKLIKGLPASVWVEVKAAAVEVDRRLEVLPVAEAAGGVPDPLDLRVQAFGRRVGDPVAQVGEDVGGCVLSIRAFSIMGWSREWVAQKYQWRTNLRAAPT